MATKISNFVVSSPGTVSITDIPFLPQHIDFYIVKKTVATDSVDGYSSGACNGLAQMAHSTFSDATGKERRSYFDRCLNHMARSGGSIVNNIAATWVSFDNNGGGDYGFTLNFSAADPNYKIWYIARD